jgi:hypothetical protein
MSRRNSHNRPKTSESDCRIRAQAPWVHGPARSPAPPPPPLGSPARVSRLNFNSNCPRQAITRLTHATHPPPCACEPRQADLSSETALQITFDGRGRRRRTGADRENFETRAGRHHRAKSSPPVTFHSTAGAAPPTSDLRLQVRSVHIYNTLRNSLLYHRTVHANSNPANSSRPPHADRRRRWWRPPLPSSR